MTGSCFFVSNSDPITPRFLSRHMSPRGRLKKSPRIVPRRPACASFFIVSHDHHFSFAARKSDAESPNSYAFCPQQKQIDLCH